MKCNAVQSIKLRHFSTKHKDLLHQVLLNIACAKENISVFHVVNKIKHSPFDYEATLKVVNGVFSTYLVTSDSSGFWITAYRKSGLNRKMTLCSYNRLYFYSLITWFWKKHTERILWMRQFACLSSEQKTRKTFPTVCWYFGLFFNLLCLPESRRINSKNRQWFNPEGADIPLRLSLTNILIRSTFWLQNSLSCIDI